MVSTVYVVDDDPAICDLIESTLVRNGINVQIFPSGEALKAAGLLATLNSPNHEPSCILLDLVLPGSNGLEVLQEFRSHMQDGKASKGLQCGCPVVIMTARGSVATAVKSMKLGAVDFLEKPFETESLLNIITEALARDQEAIERARAKEALLERIATLSPRERELLDAIVAGRSTKMIADTLGISARTVDHHRANLMAKMKAANVADVVRMAVEAGI